MFHLTVELPLFNGGELSKLRGESARGRKSQAANRQRGEKARHLLQHHSEDSLQVDSNEKRQKKSCTECYF